MNARGIVELELALQRTKMVRELAARGIGDPRVLAVFRAVPREEFVSPMLRERAYDDAPLPIGSDQTISQPYIVALTAEALALRGDEGVLDVGTGSGYAAAILSRLARHVWSIERVPELAGMAEQTIWRLGYQNVDITCGDGSAGWPEHAPYDAIAVAASAPTVPSALLEQLAPGGRLVIPIGPENGQELVRITRMGSMFRHERIADVRFVPLIGEHAWH